jgi:AcrR family transcriptional regulator
VRATRREAGANWVLTAGPVTYLELSQPVSAESVSERVPAERVRDGVFFTLPEALPRGRHTLTRDQITEAQRERLLAAVTELLAARGYRGFGVGDIATRAGVSLGAFYECFDDKDECVFAGYDRFIEVLLQKMAATEVPDDRAALVAGLLGAYLETLQQDLVVARAYQMEIDALGPPARARRRDAVNLFATYIRDRLHAPPEIPWSAYIGMVYAVRQLASDALDTAAEPDLPAIGADLGAWLSDLPGVR